MSIESDIILLLMVRVYQSRLRL